MRPDPLKRRSATITYRGKSQINLRFNSWHGGGKLHQAVLNREDCSGIVRGLWDRLGSGDRLIVEINKQNEIFSMHMPKGTQKEEWTDYQIGVREVHVGELLQMQEKIKERIVDNPAKMRMLAVAILTAPEMSEWASAVPVKKGKMTEMEKMQEILAGKGVTPISE